MFTREELLFTFCYEIPCTVGIFDFRPQIFLILYPSLGNLTTHVTMTAHLLIQIQEEFLTGGINFIASKARFLQEAY